jgi:outer membrane protein assembly factor BamB
VFLYTDRDPDDARPGNRVSLSRADERTGRIKSKVPFRGEIFGDYVIARRLGSVTVGSWSQARVIWKKDFGDDYRNEAMRAGWTGDRLIWGQRNGAVVCVALATGEKIWEISVADLYKDKVARDPGYVMTDFFFFGDLAVFSTMGHTLGISLKTGRTVWRTPMQDVLRGYLGDRIYATRAGTLDPYTGKYEFGPRLESPPGFNWKRAGFLEDVQTSTHVFGAANNGSVHAWDRMTGKHVWGMKLKGAKGGYGLKIAYGRLYYVSATQQTYCFEEVNPSELASPDTANHDAALVKAGSDPKLRPQTTKRPASVRR